MKTFSRKAATQLRNNFHERSRPGCSSTRPRVELSPGKKPGKTSRVALNSQHSPNFVWSPLALHPQPQSSTNPPSNNPIGRPALNSQPVWSSPVSSGSLELPLVALGSLLRNVMLAFASFAVNELLLYSHGKVGLVTPCEPCPAPVQ